MKLPQDSADKAAPSGWMERLVRCSSLGIRPSTSSRPPSQELSIDSGNLFGSSRIVGKTATWAIDLMFGGAGLLKNGNLMLAKTLRASGMEWSLISLRRLIEVQESSGTRLEQRIAFEAAVLVALVFKFSNGLATFLQNQVSHLLCVQQALLKARQMVSNIEEDRVHLCFFSDAFDGIDKIKRRFDGVDAKFKFRNHSGGISSKSSTNV